MTDVLIVKGITKRYPRASVDAVSDLSFTLPKGSICGFIDLMVLVKQQQCASVQLWSCQTQGMRSSTGILFCPTQMKCVDESVLCLMPFRLTQHVVRDMLKVLGEHTGCGGNLPEMKDSVVEFTTFQGMMDKPFGALSKGMKQRAALATVLMHDPQLLILDEPAAGLESEFLSGSCERCFVCSQIKERPF